MMQCGTELELQLEGLTSLTLLAASAHASPRLRLMLSAQWQHNDTLNTISSEVSLTGGGLRPVECAPIGCKSAKNQRTQSAKQDLPVRGRRGTASTPSTTQGGAMSFSLRRGTYRQKGKPAVSTYA